MDALSEIRKPIEKDLLRYQQIFSEVLTHDDESLGQALSYIKNRQGKMMRPIMVLLMAREVGQVSDKSLISAVALELLHTASLVHDDVVDESKERRGQASVNNVYGNKFAVLLGDFILSRLLLEAALTKDPRIVEGITRLGGTLSEGEIYQLSNINRQDISEDEYFRIIRHKTAALFATCAELGALSAGGSDEFVKCAKKFGEIVGICFQIRDDIFDYFDDSEIGKPTGNDLLEGKFTLPAIYAVNYCGTPHIRELAEKVKRQTASAEEIAEIVRFTLDNGGIHYAQNVMEHYREEALQLLKGFKNEQVRRSLEQYLDFVITRSN